MAFAKIISAPNSVKLYRNNQKINSTNCGKLLLAKQTQFEQNKGELS